MKKTKETSAPFVIIANLVYRAINGKLITKPKKKFSKPQLDCTNSNGAYILKFLADSQSRYPSANKADLHYRLKFILDTLLLNDVDIFKEIQDIKESLTPHEQTLVSQEEIVFLASQEQSGSIELLKVVDANTSLLNKLMASLVSTEKRMDALLEENDRLRKKVRKLEIEQERNNNFTSHLIERLEKYEKIFPEKE